MKRVIKAPPKPTPEEEIRLNRFFYLPDWQFESLIGSKCTTIAKNIIGWRKIEPQYANLYGLNAVYTETNKPCFANFFVHYKNWVYQCSEITQAIQLIELIKKEFVYDEYEEKLREKQYKEKQKLEKDKLMLQKRLPQKAA